MRVLHFDCFSGAAGDMIVGALVDLGVDARDVLEAVHRLGIPGLEVALRPVQRGGLGGTGFQVGAPERQTHRGLPEILALVKKSGLAPGARRIARRVFERLCEVEGRLHGVPAEKVHLHEVGAVDSVADVVAAAFCIDRLAPDRISCSALPTGSGTVSCEHGTLPVPAPATLELLRGCPVYPGPVEREMVTPTGAAILTTVASAFGAMPAMTIRRTGFGTGSRENPGHPNLLRVIEGEADPSERRESSIVVIETNVDDMNPQDVGPLPDRLREAGAVDVFVTPVLMKKSRPGLQITVLAPEASHRAVCERLFRETTTIGLRYHRASRWELDREIDPVETRFGAISLKVSRLDGKVVNVTAEHDDCLRAAREHGVAVAEVRQEALNAYRTKHGEDR